MHILSFSWLILLASEDHCSGLRHAAILVSERLLKHVGLNDSGPGLESSDSGGRRQYLLDHSQTSSQSSIVEVNQPDPEDAESGVYGQEEVEPFRIY